MVLSIIAASFCIPLLIISSIGVWDEGYVSRHWAGLFPIQIFITLIEAAVAINSTLMAFRAICVCFTRKEEGTVYYTTSRGKQLQNVLAHQIISDKRPRPGYIAIPENSLDDTMGAIALPTPSNMSETPPPNYEAVAESETEGNEKRS